MKYDLTHEYITEIFDYSVCTDYLTWKVKKAPNIEIGQKAGTLNFQGYVRVRIDGKDYLVHNLIWFYIFEEWPLNELDHRNNKKSNNNIFNLREATHLQNGANKKINKNNKSGYKGVSWHKQHKKHGANIKKDGKPYHLGYYDCPIEAALAYDKAAKEFFGPFANLNFPDE